MKTYSAKEAPLQVFGVPFFAQTKLFQRLSPEFRQEMPKLQNLGRRCSGARVGFRTDARELTVTVRLETLGVDVGMGLYGCQSAHVMVGPRQNSAYVAIVNPPDYQTKVFSKTIALSGQMQDVTVWLPKNEVIEDLQISVPDEASVEPPTPYRYGTALYYGSSITEGAGSAGSFTPYSAVLSRLLDLDYYNFGFSGSAGGELIMADYISTIDFNLFICDYDHNAPDVEFLRNTHEPFFLRFREHRPETPVILMSCPDFEHFPDAADRRAVIRQTWENAVARGDQNVYFLDGESFFGDTDRPLCTTDTVHPNDLGHYRMAQAILPTLQHILSKRTG